MPFFFYKSISKVYNPTFSFISVLIPLVWSATYQLIKVKERDNVLTKFLRPKMCKHVLWTYFKAAWSDFM